MSPCALSAPLLLAVALAAPAEDAPTAEAFVAPYDVKQFDSIFVEALDAFLSAEAAYRQGDYAQAEVILGALWAKHPPASADWPGGLVKPAGLNIGSPPCYYALRMLTECVDWRLNGSESPLRPNTATLTVLLIDQAHGTQPTTLRELEDGTGVEAQHEIDPLLIKDESRIVHDALWLFEEYMTAITDGQLEVETQILHLEDLGVPVSASARPLRYAGLADEAWEMIWGAIPNEMMAKTDWWWVLYPSHVPGQYPEFETTEFITGGMGRGPDAGSPCFIIDDQWLVRKPPHLGSGLMSDIERRTYLPQWLQHEFFHHIFACYPEFGLEAQGHQWFDKTTWPADFEGRFEPDYYYEGLHKRIRPLGEPPLHVRLLYAPPPRELFVGLRVEDIIGRYRHEPYENDWHEGSLQEVEGGAGELRWTNNAGISWTLQPELAEGRMRAGEDNPYFADHPVDGRAFRLVLERGEDGAYTPKIIGFVFLSTYYERLDD